MTHENAKHVGANQELGRLVAQLHDIQDRIFELTGGKVDAVVGQRHGTSLLPHAQERLRENEALHRRYAAQRAAILDALPANIALLESTGRIVVVNDAWRNCAEANGLTADDAAIGMNYVEVCETARDRGAVRAGEIARGIRSVLLGEAEGFSTEYATRAGDGERWFQLLVAPLRGGSDAGAVVMHIDITTRKLAEREIAQVRDRLETLIREASVGILVRRHFTPLMANDELARIFGYDSAAAIMRLDDTRTLLAEEERDRESQHTQARMRGEAPPRAYSLKGRTRDGTALDLETRAFAVTWDGATAICDMVTNVTAQNRLLEQLQQAQKLEAVGHLTGGVAHDFNNLLTVILGNAESLADLITDPELRTMAEMTMSAAERGAQLISRLLAFARRRPLAPKPTDVNQLVAGTETLIRSTLPESIDLDFVPDPDLGVAEIDAAELDTALLNLGVNARDVMQDGGRLTVETANVVLDSDYARHHQEIVPGEYVMVCVSDTGKGMDPETVRRAVEPFFTTKAVGEGSGLGLSMVFGFTKQSGGHIKIYSEPGVGTSVKLYFPRVRLGQDSSVPSVAQLRPQGGTEHILIAEDNELVLKHLEGQLLSLGYRVTSAMSGPEALSALQAQDDVDLLLTDVVMPGGMNGRDLADRAQAARPSLKVLFTSGYTDNALVHHGRLDPGIALLSKPYTRLELATKVPRVLDST